MGLFSTFVNWLTGKKEESRVNDGHVPPYANPKVLHDRRVNRTHRFPSNPQITKPVVTTSSTWEVLDIDVPAPVVQNHSHHYEPTIAPLHNSPHSNCDHVSSHHDSSASYHSYDSGSSSD